MALELATVGSGVDEAAERHVPGDAGEAVEPGDPPLGPGIRRSGSSRLSPSGHRSILATAHAAPKPLSIPTTVIPAAHEACIASNAVTPFERRAVADARRHGDHRRRGETRHEARQRPLHPGDDDDRVRLGDLLDRGEESMDAGHPAIGEQRRAEAEGTEDGQALLCDGKIRRARGADEDAPGSIRLRAPGHGAEPAGLGLQPACEPRRETASSEAATWASSARVRSTGPLPPAMTARRRSLRTARGSCPARTPLRVGLGGAPGDGRPSQSRGPRRAASSAFSPRRRASTRRIGDRLSILRSSSSSMGVTILPAWRHRRRLGARSRS